MRRHYRPLIIFFLTLLCACTCLRAVAAVAFEDSLAQRLLACTGCHGQQGRAGPDGYYPRLAGKPAGYLYNQLRNFQSGRRHYGFMVNLLQPLPDPYLREIAQHFSAIDAPYLPPMASAAPAQVLQRGRDLATQGDASRELPACIECHGEFLTGVSPFTPGLLGLPRDYLNAQLGAWRSGERAAQAPDCMALVARRLAPEDVVAVVSWLAAQPVRNAGKPAAALPKPMPLACGSTPATPSVATGAAR